MNKRLFQLMVALTVLVSTDALAADPKNMLSKLSAPGVGQDVQQEMNIKRSLRGLKTTDDATDEERGGTTTLVQKLETALAKSSLGQKVQELKQVKVAEREALVKKLLEEQTSFKTLSSHKVTPDEYLKASGINTAKLPLKNAAVSSPEYDRLVKYARYLDKQKA